MKLAFCLFKYFPYGGLERNFLRAALLCRSRGHDVTVYTGEWQGEIAHGLDVSVLQLSRASSHGRATEFTRAVARFLADGNFDVIVGFNKMPGLDLYYAADPCLQHRLREKFGSFYQLNPRYRAFITLEEAVFSTRSETEIMLLDPREQEIFRRYYGTPDHRFHVLPPGISRDRIAPSNAAEIREKLRRDFSIRSEHKLIVHIGSAFKRKGLDRALDAMASLPATIREKTRMIVVGEGDARPFLRMARRLKLVSQVQILGARHDVPRFLLGADVLIHPARSETTGTVILEAIVAGLPVLATGECGWAHHVLDARAGRIVSQPFNQTELNRLLHEMLTSAEHDEWRSNALDYAKNNDLYGRTERIVEIVEAKGLAGSSRGRRERAARERDVPS